MRRGRRNAGMTLVEVMVVVTIVAIAGAAILPSVAAGLDSLRLKSTADRLANTFRYAREHALRMQVVCQVTVDPQKNRVEMQALGRQVVRREWEMPAEITVREYRPRTFVFTPDGGSPRVQITLENPRGRTAVVEMDVLTALPSVEYRTP